jgi:hypothetical protein
MSKERRKRLVWTGAIVLALAYAASYCMVTQDRYGRFRELHAVGFWYVPWETETSESWERKEQFVAAFYYPMNYLEYDVLGFGMPHASCSPFFRLAK